MQTDAEREQAIRAQVAATEAYLDGVLIELEPDLTPEGAVLVACAVASAAIQRALARRT